MRRQLVQFLMTRPVTHFITLATNHQSFSPTKMRKLLQDWDARVNRQLVGTKWIQRHDERLLFIAFLEQAKFNPHWHLLVEADPVACRGCREMHWQNLGIIADASWKRLVPSGTTDTQVVANGNLMTYVTKELTSDFCWSQVTLSKEFRSR